MSPVAHCAESTSVTTETCILQRKERDRKTSVSSSLSASLLHGYALWVIVVQICSHIWPVKLFAGSYEMLIIQQK